MKIREARLATPSELNETARKIKSSVSGFGKHAGLKARCPTPGMKIRSRGMGRGLARGRGFGPVGVPYKYKQ